MIAVIARLTAKPGAGAALEKLVRAFREQVCAHEPGCTLYQPCKGQTADDIVVLQRYESQAALESHSKSAHFLAASGEAGTLLGKAPVIEVLTEI